MLNAQLLIDIEQRTCYDYYVGVYNPQRHEMSLLYIERPAAFLICNRPFLFLRIIHIVQCVLNHLVDQLIPANSDTGSLIVNDFKHIRGNTHGDHFFFRLFCNEFRQYAHLPSCILYSIMLISDIFIIRYCFPNTLYADRKCPLLSCNNPIGDIHS